jgi:hypothetical protein
MGEQNAWKIFVCCDHCSWLVCVGLLAIRTGEFKPDGHTSESRDIYRRNVNDARDWQWSGTVLPLRWS